MEFKLTVVKEKAAPITMPITIPVPEEMRLDIQRIKKSSKRNSQIINDMARQFFAQLIAKYNAGEFEESA